MHTLLKKNWLTVLAIIVLVSAWLPFAMSSVTLPYAYYQLLNWIVAGSALTIAYRAHAKKMAVVMWVSVAVAVVFNPIAPLYLDEATWRILDLVAALVLAASSWFVQSRSA